MTKVMSLFKRRLIVVFTCSALEGKSEESTIIVPSEVVTETIFDPPKGLSYTMIPGAISFRKISPQPLRDVIQDLYSAIHFYKDRGNSFVKRVENEHLKLRKGAQTILSRWEFLSSKWYNGE